MDEMKRKTAVAPKALGDLESAQKESLELLKKDPRVYAVIHDEFGLTLSETRRALAPLLDFYDDLHYCDSCPGYEKCEKEVPHYQIELFREGGLVDRKLHLCPIAKKRESYDASFLDRDFPIAWMNETMKRSVSRTGKKNAALVSMLRILKKETEKGVYLFGNRGTGRSFMLACLANDYVGEHGGPVSFVDTTSLLDKLRALSFASKEKFSRTMNAYGNLPLLVLDDFGNEPKEKSGFVFSSILFPLLNERAKNGLVTCFSSDFTMQEVADMYAPSIGAPRARQFRGLLDAIASPFDITGIPER